MFFAALPHLVVLIVVLLGDASAESVLRLGKQIPGLLVSGRGGLLDSPTLTCWLQPPGASFGTITSWQHL